MSLGRGWAVYAGPCVRPPDGVVGGFTLLSCAVTFHEGTWMCHLILCNWTLSFGWVDK